MFLFACLFLSLCLFKTSHDRRGEQTLPGEEHLETCSLCAVLGDGDTDADCPTSEGT